MNRWEMEELDTVVVWYTAKAVQLGSNVISDCRLYFWGAWVMIERADEIVAYPSHRVEKVTGLVPIPREQVATDRPRV